MVSIEDLIRSIGEGKILITDHADEEAEADVLSFDEVYFSVVHGEIIETLGVNYLWEFEWKVPTN